MQKYCAAFLAYLFFQLPVGLSQNEANKAQAVPSVTGKLVTDIAPQQEQQQVLKKYSPPYLGTYPLLGSTQSSANFLRMRHSRFQRR